MRNSMSLLVIVLAVILPVGEESGAPARIRSLTSLGHSQIPTTYRWLRLRCIALPSARRCAAETVSVATYRPFQSAAP